ncbi:selenoprotein S-like [Babylonia areolata]|uniref:selenoprotein S-like n=1 Tax=Babylonia areolata TaxID=304850 RepID=UPI003FD09422
MNGAEQEEPDILQNETPESLTGAVSAGFAFLQQYGWFLLLGVVVVLYLKSRFLQPRLDSWQQQREDASYKKMDEGKAQSQLEAMERARQRMQEQLDRQAAEYKLKQKEKEEKARQEKIADWERHQEGKGYRSKIRAKEEEEGPSQPKPKPKKPLRSDDYNPLMGTSGGASFRPPRRGPSTGGG